ncbi:rpoE leader peptide RseD [Enterobacter cloacae]
MLKSAGFVGWRFNNAWNFGLGRHYLG